MCVLLELDLVLVGQVLLDGRVAEQRLNEALEAHASRRAPMMRAEVEPSVGSEERVVEARAAAHADHAGLVRLAHGLRGLARMRRKKAIMAQRPQARGHRLHRAPEGALDSAVQGRGGLHSLQGAFFSHFQSLR